MNNADWTLARLIAARKGDRSFKRLSTDCGGTPTANRLQQMSTKEISAFPDPDTIRGIAMGLGTTITEVTLAAARSLGLNVASGEPDALIVAGAGTLPAEAQEAILGVSREMQRLYRLAGLKPLVALPGGGRTGGLADFYIGHAAFDATARGEVESAQD